MERKVLIVGANVEGDNIGSAIEAEIRDRNYQATGQILRDYQDLMTVTEIRAGGYTDLVVSCGKTVMRPFVQQTDHDLSGVIDACLFTPMVACRRFAASRWTQGSPPSERSTIVLIGSYAHNHVLSNSAAYCSAKAGLHMLGQCLGWELTRQGIDTIVVHPHSVEDTPMTRQVLGAIGDQKGLSRHGAEEYWRKDQLLPSRLTKAEIADLVARLILVPRTPHMSGASIELYGGSR